MHSVYFLFFFIPVTVRYTQKLSSPIFTSNNYKPAIKKRTLAIFSILLFNIASGYRVGMIPPLSLCKIHKCLRMRERKREGEREKRMINHYYRRYAYTYIRPGTFRAGIHTVRRTWREIQKWVSISIKNIE